MTVVVVTAKEGDYHQAIDEGLDCLVQDVTENAWWQWCLFVSISVVRDP